MSKPFPETKRCNGPAHAEPVLLPLDGEHWYFHRTGSRVGSPVTPCRQCVNWSKLLKPEGPHGYVPIKDVLPYVRELVERCGSIYKTCRRHGFAEDTLRQALNGGHEQMQKKTIGRVLLALQEQRQFDRKNGTSSRFHEEVRRRAEAEKRRMRSEWNRE